MRKRLLFISFLLLQAFIVFGQKSVSIGIILDKNEPFIDEYFNLVKTEIDALLKVRYDVEYDKYVIEGLSVGFNQVIEKAYAHNDIVIALGFVPSQRLIELSAYQKPSIAAIALIRDDKKTSGLHNFTYFQAPHSVKRDLQTFQDIYGFKKLGVIIEDIIIKNLPHVVEEIESLLKGVDFEIFDISNDPNVALQQLPEGIDAIYFLKRMDFSDEDNEVFITGINERKIPSFSLHGRPEVEKGIMASISSSGYIPTYGRRIALDVLKIMEGQNPSELSTIITGIDEDFVINYETVKALGISIKRDIINKISIINVMEGNKKKGKKYTLQSAIYEALLNNLDIKDVEKNIETALKDVIIARSNIFPNISASSSFTVYDDESAKSMIAEQVLAGHLSLSQVVFNEPVYANIAIKKLIKETEEESLRQQQIDIILNTATAYLNYLNAADYVKIQLKNLEVTRYNYNVAKRKEETGESGIADVNRFEAEMARNRISLNDAITTLNIVRYDFNNVINRPVNEKIDLADVMIDDQIIFAADERIDHLIADMGDITTFVEYMVNYGKEHLPEIVQIKLALDIQKRSLRSNKRSLFVPQLSLSANANKNFSRFGDYTSAADMKARGVDPYNIHWNAMINASLPVFQGFKRSATIEKDKLTIEQLSIEKENIERNLELALRSAVEAALNSFNDIKLSQAAYHYSTENFNIIQNLYRQGRVDISRFVDAQNILLQSELSVSDATYQFMKDFLTLERYIGFYYMLANDKEREEFMQNLIQYLITNKTDS